MTSTSPFAFLGNGPLTDATELANPHLLNPDWWPAINFYARANSNYDPTKNGALDKTYALIQREAFNAYTNNVRPLSTGMVLWNYSLPKGKSDLSSIYNEQLIDTGGGGGGGGGDTTTSGKLGDSPLSKGSLAFPNFGESRDGNLGPNTAFANFATAMMDTNNNYFLQNRGDVTDSVVGIGANNIGLMNIPYGAHYTQDKSDMFLISQANAFDGNTFLTYSAPLMNLFQAYEASFDNGSFNPTVNNAIMKSMPKTYDGGATPDASHQMFYGVENGAITGDNKDTAIMQNFLFADPLSTKADGKNISKYPYAATASTVNKGCLDLAAIYHNSGTNHTDDHIDLFNNDPSPKSTYPWYNRGARYLLNAVRLYNPKGGTSLTDKNNYLPYIMIRNDSGVHVEGIDGVNYLAQVENESSNLSAADSTWRPGKPFSQERENQLLKYRTIYENKAATPVSGTGIALIKQSSGSGSDKSVTGPLVDYFKNADNTDDIILNAIKTSNTKYSALNLFGLNDKDGKLQANIWNDKLQDLIQSFDRLNIFMNVISSYDTATSKLFGYTTTYAGNESLPLPTEDGHINEFDKIYSNGLAMSLPIVYNSGVNSTSVNPDGVFNPTYKNYFDVAVAAVCDVAETNGLDVNSTTPLGSYSFNGSTGVMSYIPSGDTSLVSLKKDVVQKFTDWCTTLKPADSNDVFSNPFNDGKGNKSANLYNYSEHILTYNRYANTLLWTYGSNSNSVNSEKMYALQKYIGTDSFDNYSDAIASLYLSKQVLTGDTKFNSLINTGSGGGEVSFNDYVQTLKTQWNYKNSLDIGGATGSTLDDVGNSDRLLQYATIKATIKYLTDNGYAQFMTWMNDQVSTDIQNSTYIAWISKDNPLPGLQTDFNKLDLVDGKLADKDAGKVYGWKSNYANMYEEYYQNTNINGRRSHTYGDYTYTTFDQYWQFAPMPQVDGTGMKKLDAMGYLGLQTNNSNNLPSNVKTDLFDKYATSCDNLSDGHELTGALYSCVSRDNLWNKVNDLPPSPNNILNWANFINKQLGEEFNSVLSQIEDVPNNQPGGQGQKQKSILLDAIKPPAGTNSPIPDCAFNGYNKNFKSHNVLTPTLELTNPENGNPVIADSSDSTNLTGTRTRVMQINKDDVSSVEKLQNAVGSDLFNYLIVQAALESSKQSATIKDVISTMYSNKVTVYDRRWNDALGSLWVNNYKNKN